MAFVAALSFHYLCIQFVTPLYMKIFWLVLALFLCACRGEELLIPAEYERLPLEARSLESFSPDEPIGMYILNEGNMGSNKSTIDYVDFVNATFIRNIYSERNPEVIKELGDVGNDIAIYGSKLYAVINCSHKVEVMDARTCKRLGQIDIPNCRFIDFAGGKAYVSSYVGPVSIDPDAQQGAVFEVDTASLKITRQVTVGYQPEELLATDDYIYVANSGGYRKPNYDNTLSVINRTTMKQVRKLKLGLNLQCVEQDRQGRLWVSARGDLDNPTGERAPGLYVLTPLSPDLDEVDIDILDYACSVMQICGDSLFYIHSSSLPDASNFIFGIIDVNTQKQVTDCFVEASSAETYKMPYGLLVNPYNRQLFVTDAKNYVSSGVLHCYDPAGKELWQVRTGDIPSRMVFLYK